LFGAESDDGNAARALVLGLSDFGDVLRALPHAADEVAMLREVLDGRGEFLWGAQATRHKLLDLDATGELRRFDVLHLATHAVLDSAAPHQSRVLLADDALTALDIFDLSLNARLVTLSACQTALGQGGQGDELLGLARAFFYAGARALLATLWQVEDCSMVELTQRFYRHWADGANLAIALRQAQIEMIRAGSPPYHWAPFVLMGQP
jgi:CHAT domain-containing protein